MGRNAAFAWSGKTGHGSNNRSVDGAPRRAVRNGGHTSGSSPVPATAAYQRALDFGMRAWDG